MAYITTYRTETLPRWSEETVEAWRPDGRLRTIAKISRHPGPGILHGAVSARDGYADLIGAGILSRRGGRVLLADATWQPGSRAFERLIGQRREVAGVDEEPRGGRWLTRSVIRAIDNPGLHYGVLSRHEVNVFPTVWGVAAQRVHFIPFCATLPSDTEPARTEESVFAGGDSLRDYRSLVAAREVIEWPVVVASHLYAPSNEQGESGLGPLQPDEYDNRARRAGIVVVPLIDGTTRSAGQQTYLNAMLLGQAVVVTRAPGVSDYIEPNRTGVVVDNNPRALAEAINGLISNPQLRRQLGEAAREEVLRRFRLDHWFERLLDLAASLQAIR